MQVRLLFSLIVEGTCSFFFRKTSRISASPFSEDHYKIYEESFSSVRLLLHQLHSQINTVQVKICKDEVNIQVLWVCRHITTLNLFFLFFFFFSDKRISSCEMRIWFSIFGPYIPVDTTNILTKNEFITGKFQTGTLIY